MCVGDIEKDRDSKSVRLSWGETVYGEHISKMKYDTIKEYKGNHRIMLTLNRTQIEFNRIER